MLLYLGEHVVYFRAGSTPHDPLPVALPEKYLEHNPAFLADMVETLPSDWRRVIALPTADTGSITIIE